MRILVLPAVGGARRVGAPGPPALPEAPPAPGETVCFYNPDRRATTSCSHCGVFISEAWAAPWGAETVCFKCLEDLRGRRQDARFQSRRVLWDNLALGLASAPFLFSVPLLLLGPFGAPFIILCLMMSIVTAPTGLGMAIFAWNKPRSLVPRGRARLVWALLLSLLQCAGWGLALAAAVSGNLS